MEQAKLFPPTPLSLWRARMGLSQAAAAAALGVSIKGYQVWERGFTFIDNEPIVHQRRVLLAASVIEHGLARFAKDRDQTDLKEWRERAGLSRGEAACALGVSYKRYGEWEIGQDYTLKTAITKLDLRTWLACLAIEHGLAEISLVDAKPARAVPVVARPRPPKPVVEKEPMMPRPVAKRAPPPQPVTRWLVEPVQPAPRPVIPDQWASFYQRATSLPYEDEVDEPETESGAAAVTPSR